MKFCTKCGFELEECAVSCKSCGAPALQGQVQPQMQPTTESQAIKHKDTASMVGSMGIAAFVLSILGFLTGFAGVGFFFDLVAIGLASFVLIKAKPIKKGLTIAAICIAGASLVLVVPTHISDYSTVSNVQNLIKDIGEVTVDSGDKIKDAEEAYQALASSDKERIKNHDTLVEARKKFDSLPTPEVENVKKLISEIGTVTTDSQSKIEAAEKAYAVLDGQSKTKVDNYGVLTLARIRYNQIKPIWKKDYYVDDFKQRTSNWYIHNEENFVGTFSNSATTDSLLYAIMTVDYNGYACIVLYEYGNHQVKNYGSYNDDYSVSVRLSDGTQKDLNGYIYGGGDRIGFNGNDNAWLINALKTNENILFSITNKKYTLSNYVFTAKTQGFEELYNTAVSGQ